MLVHLILIVNKNFFLQGNVLASISCLKLNQDEDFDQQDCVSNGL